MKTPVEHVFKSTETDQDKAMNEATAYGINHGWELVAIMWEKEEGGKHIFKITHMVDGDSN